MFGTIFTLAGAVVLGSLGAVGGNKIGSSLDKTQSGQNSSTILKNTYTTVKGITKK